MSKNQKEIFSNNLKKWLSIRNKTQNDIVESCGISPSTVSDWCNAKKFPRIDKIEMLANFLNIYKSDLIEEHSHFDNPSPSSTSIPLLSMLKTGYEYLQKENWEGTISIGSDLMSENSDYFALKIKNDFMSPLLIEDDIVVIKKQNDFQSGDLVLSIANKDEVKISKGIKLENSILLQPINPSYEPSIFTYDDIKNNSVIIVGVVKQLKREF